MEVHYALSNEPKVNSVRCLYTQMGSKTQMAVFRLKVHYARINSATKFLCVNIVSDKL